MRILSVGIVRASDDSCNNAPVRQAAARGTQYSHPRTLNRSATEEGGTSPPGEGLHLVLDSTGLSIVGAGEWAAAKHGGCGRCGWRKLHLGVDQSGVIRVHTLTEETSDDATTALDLLTAVEDPLVRVTADAAYDTVAVYETATAGGGVVA